MQGSGVTKPVKFSANETPLLVFNSKSQATKVIDNKPTANMATISPKRGFSVATVAKGWSLVYMLMRVREVIVGSLC